MEEQQFVDIVSPLFSCGEKLHGNMVQKEIQQKGFPVPFRNCVKVKDSLIHGKGVFAKEDIANNRVIGLYPFHGWVDKNKFYCLEDYKTKFDEVKTLVSEYKIKNGSNNFIFGLPQIQDDYLLGHLINDSYPNVNELKSISDYESFSKFYEKYMINSLVRNNCVFVKTDGFIYIKTVKPIKKGEELVNSYDISYWIKELTVSEIMSMIDQYYSSLTGKRKSFVLEKTDQIALQTKPLNPSPDSIQVGNRLTSLYSRYNFSSSIISL